MTSINGRRIGLIQLRNIQTKQASILAGARILQVFCALMKLSLPLGLVPNELN